MTYHISRTIPDAFDSAVERVTGALKSEGFGVLTQIDVQATLKRKLDVDFRKYMILGACNPRFALNALEVESHIGTMLPCNVVVQESENGGVEVSAVDPLASMQAVENTALKEIAGDVRNRLRRVIEGL